MSGDESLNVGGRKGAEEREEEIPNLHSIIYLKNKSVIDEKTINLIHILIYEKQIELLELCFIS